MQTAAASFQRRCLILLAVLLVTCAVSWAATGARQAAAARWPREDAVFDLAGWTAGPEKIDAAEGTEAGGQPLPITILERAYRRLGGGNATFVMWTAPQPHAKVLYRKGPVRDFEGAGYVVSVAPATLVSPAPGRGALVVSRGPETYLVLYAYGERRGLLGNGLRGWAAAEFDALLDRPNDYFLARLQVPYPGRRTPAVDDALALADDLFPRLARWYAAPAAPAR